MCTTKRQQACLKGKITAHMSRLRRRFDFPLSLFKRQFASRILLGVFSEWNYLRTPTLSDLFFWTVSIFGVHDKNGRSYVRYRLTFGCTFRKFQSSAVWALTAQSFVHSGSSERSLPLALYMTASKRSSPTYESCGKPSSHRYTRTAVFRCVVPKWPI